MFDFNCGDRVLVKGDVWFEAIYWSYNKKSKLHTCKINYNGCIAEIHIDESKILPYESYKEYKGTSIDNYEAMVFKEYNSEGFMFKSGNTVLFRSCGGRDYPKSKWLRGTISCYHEDNKTYEIIHRPMDKDIVLVFTVNEKFVIPHTSSTNKYIENTSDNHFLAMYKFKKIMSGKESAIEQLVKTETNNDQSNK